MEFGLDMQNCGFSGGQINMKFSRTIKDSMKISYL